MGVSLPVAQDFLRGWLPKEARWLDQVEADLASLDEASPTGAATIAITYGSPPVPHGSGGFGSGPSVCWTRTGRKWAVYLRKACLPDK